VREKCSTLAVAPKGVKCLVRLLTKTIAVFTSDCWLLKFGVKFGAWGRKQGRSAQGYSSGLQTMYQRQLQHGYGSQVEQNR